ncbi:acyl-CoA desaturase [Nocardia sp. NPDC006630]|uniref:fatty acid desaturase family protein n=1 Tax=Nocardia sp. NPDC006630 TaxID=3157181 RepID=UPI0033A3B531
MTIVPAGSLGRADLDYATLFAGLQREVRAAGLMDPRPGRYVVWVAGNSLLILAGFATLAVVGDSWWVLAVAVFLAFAHGQNAVVAHDIGHRQVFRHRRSTDIAGYVTGNVLMGVSYGWWVWHHNRHHGNPNHLTLDPDIVRRQVIFSTAQLPARRGAFHRFVIRRQGWLFFVLIMFESIRLHLAGFIAAAKGAITRNKALDAGLLAAHLVAYTGYVAWVLSPVYAILVIVVHQALFGFYLGILFAPNHKGLPVRDGDEELDWCRRQICTSRNQQPNPVVDYVMGGLNYQIEHHLFPTMPSINLRRARPLVWEFCRTYELPYAETGFFASYREVAKFLSDVSGQAAPMLNEV